ncbi:MAG: alpha/beta fold hydrolase [Planctomycetota bacterium]|nr:MAG: alpha/beta fold hydrolase [Planctomycetota bacterium]
MFRPAQDFRTLAPYAANWIAPPRTSAPRPWSARVVDPRVGDVLLSGELRDPANARELYVVLHGLGGTPRSPYCLRTIRAAEKRGAATLALALRGADRRGEDFYNIAQREDVAAALASPELARYERIHVIGCSMGGYVALHYARGPVDPRVRSVAALCTPIDLHAAQRHIDTRGAWLYRTHVLNGLKEIYAAVVARGRFAPSEAREVGRVRTMYEWDRLAIAPRYGFESPEAYYRAFSIEPYLARLAVRTLLVAAEDDPVIPIETIRPFLPKANGPKTNGGELEVRFVPRGGHLGAGRTFDEHVLDWCAR